MTPPSQPPGDSAHKQEPGRKTNLAEVHPAVLREQPEPRASREPIPLGLLALFFGAIICAGLYLARNSGEFRADVFDPAPAAGGVAAPTGPVDPKVLGRRVYTRNCLVCHQATGLGVAGQFPPLAGSEWVLGQDWHGDNHLVKIVLKGLQGPIQVQGKTFNNAMPTWSMLTDGQIADVLTYIRSEWGNAAPPIFADYVRAIREQPPARAEPWAPKDLQAIPAENAPPATAHPSPVPTPSPAASSA